MKPWIERLVPELLKQVKSDNVWGGLLREALTERLPSVSTHLAVFVEPFLQFVLEGRKPVESRFSSKKCVPYDAISENDVILLKRSGGPIVGVCEVSKVWFYELDPQSWRSIRDEFAVDMCAQDPGFWNSRENAAYATLLQLGRVKAIPPIYCPKRDRRGWVVLRTRGDQRPLPFTNTNNV
jgi:hypothetical protein